MAFLQSYESAWNDTLAMWSPPPTMTGSEWADAYFWLSPESSSSDLKKWHTLPYQRGILDAMTDPEIPQVTVKKSARIGYTKMLNIVSAKRAHNNPRNVLIVQPTIEDAQGYSKDEFDPMLRDVPVLQQLYEDRARHKDNTILRKHFPGMTVYMIGANSPRGFRRISAGDILFDEVNGYPASAGDEGDQILLGKRRADYYIDPKFIYGSTPTDSGSSRITDLYGQSDMRRYHVPCPYCDFEQHLRWSNIDFTRKGTVKRPVYLCADCEKAIEYSRHRWMMERGLWKAEKEFDGHAGFHIWAAYSYSPNATWHHIVKAFLESKENRLKLKTWVNTWQGEDSDIEAERIDVNPILNRRENFAEIMPMGTAILTAQVDTQDDRLVVLRKAWGRDEESFSLDRIEIIGNPALKDTWDKLDALLLKPVPHMNGNTYNIHCSLVDAGGHFTDQVYAFVKPRRARNVFAIKGSKDQTAPIISRPKKSKRSKSYKYGVDLITVGVNTAKDLLSSRLQLEEPGPGYIHMPLRFGKEIIDELAAEEKQVKYHMGNAIYVWKQVRPRNEQWDLEVYGIAAVRIVCPDVSILNRYVDQLEGKAQKKQKPLKRKKKGFVSEWKI